jgi:hypothetical protein
MVLTIYIPKPLALFTILQRGLEEKQKKPEQNMLETNSHSEGRIRPIVAIINPLFGETSNPCPARKLSIPISPPPITGSFLHEETGGSFPRFRLSRFLPVEPR